MVGEKNARVQFKAVSRRGRLGPAHSAKMKKLQADSQRRFWGRGRNDWTQQARAGETAGRRQDGERRAYEIGAGHVGWSDHAVPMNRHPPRPWYISCTTREFPTTPKGRVLVGNHYNDVNVVVVTGSHVLGYLARCMSACCVFQSRISKAHTLR
jgi:hypothetical protein